MADKKKIITVWAFAQALVKAGVMTEDEVNHTTHFVIDCNPKNGQVVLYIERFADETMLDVAMSLSGIEVTVVGLSDNEVQAVIRSYSNPLLIENCRAARETDPTSQWTKLLVDEIERRGNPAVILASPPKTEYR